MEPIKIVPIMVILAVIGYGAGYGVREYEHRNQVLKAKVAHYNQETGALELGALPMSKDEIERVKQSVHDMLEFAAQDKNYKQIEPLETKNSNPEKQPEQQPAKKKHVNSK